MEPLRLVPQQLGALLPHGLRLKQDQGAVVKAGDVRMLSLQRGIQFPGERKQPRAGDIVRGHGIQDRRERFLRGGLEQVSQGLRVLGDFLKQREQVSQITRLALIEVDGERWQIEDTSAQSANRIFETAAAMRGAK